MYLENRLAEGTLEIGGRKVSLAKSPVELYVLSARDDHITPCHGCYRTTQLTGVRPVRADLVGSHRGDRQPARPQRRHWVNDQLLADPHEWLSGAAEQQGSWWRTGPAGRPSGAVSTATRHRWGATHPQLEDAPGTYVHG